MLRVLLMFRYFCANVLVASNSLFKPNLLRYTNSMQEKLAMWLAPLRGSAYSNGEAGQALHLLRAS